MRKVLIAGAAAIATLALPATVSVAGTFGNDYRIVVHNESGMTVLSVQASNRDSRRWGPDLLGAYTIPPGEAKVLNVDDFSGYCIFDLRAQSDVGGTWERYQVNVCEVSDWYLGN